MEFELISRIQAKVGRAGPGVLRGIGDDCAVIGGKTGKLTLLTTDAIVEGRHFYRPFFKPFEIGLKAVATAVSDVAAMGGHPLHLLISLGLPKKGAERFVNGFYDGVRTACRKWNLSVVGGNLTASKILWISTTVIGEVEKKDCRYRSGAKPGDGIFVTGPLGNAAMGLFLHQRGRKIPPVFARAQKTPVPRLREGEFLGKFSGVTSLIDISDGLLADLGHILATSRAGAVLEWEKIPRHPQLGPLAKKNGFSIRDLVLSRGEDYELLATVRRSVEKTLIRMAKSGGIKLFRIGTIVRRAQGLKIVDSQGKNIPFSASGYDHFKSY